MSVAVTGGAIFTSALTLAFAYTYTQGMTGQKVGFFIMQIPAPMLPFAMLAMTAVTQGAEPAFVQLPGLVAAHLYDFLQRIWPTFGGGRTFIYTPAFVKRWFLTGPTSGTSRGFGTAFAAPAQQPARGTASGSSTRGPLPASWQSRGSGHRLGGD